MKQSVPRYGSIAAAIVVLAVIGGTLAYHYGPRLLGGPPVPVTQISPALAQQVVSDPNLPTAGNPAGAMTVAEFFDYRCPACRMMQPRLESLTAKDNRVRVVFKEWPIMGGVSVTAARWALAAQWQGKYLPAHDALMALPASMNEPMMRTALAQAGIDMPRLARDLAAHERDIEAQLRQNQGDARRLGFPGTPSLVIGTATAPGALSEAQLQTLVNQANRQD